MKADCHTDLDKTRDSTEMYKINNGTNETLETQRVAFSVKENSLIRKHLKSYIQTNKKIDKYEFQEFVSDTPELADIVAKFGNQKLVVKIRTERKC